MLLFLKIKAVSQCCGWVYFSS